MIRIWVSIVTIVLLGLIVFFAWDEIVHAWELLGTINVGILALTIPLQIVAYFAAGEMMFSYLRAAKTGTRRIKGLTQARMALEMNFVNHVLPSGGVSGISYMNWRLKQYGISAGRATAAQLVRYVAQFASFTVLLLIAVAWITLDGDINRSVILISSLIVLVMLISTVAIFVVVSSKRRSQNFAGWLATVATGIFKTITFGRYKSAVSSEPIAHFLVEMHDEFLTLKRERKLMMRPFLWGLVFNVFEISLFAITFWALGSPISPAPILIAYGLASIAGLLIITPGGTGAYEAIMVSFLATAGIKPGVAIAGILVTRIVVLLGTIGFGYIFYQHAVIKHGKRST